MQTLIELWRVRCSQAEYLMKIQMVYAVMSNYLYGGVLQRTDQGCVSLCFLVPYAVNQYIKITNSGASKGPLSIGTAMTQSPCVVHALNGFINKTAK